jgi:hypothetical protein
MADFYALTSSPLPKKLHGTSLDCSIRRLSSPERLEIEDHFFKKSGTKTGLDHAKTAIVVSQQLAHGSNTEEFATLIEFAVAILTVSGFQPIEVAAAFNGTTCTDAIRRPPLQRATAPIVFAKSITGIAASAWLLRFFAARRNSLDRMHITADRFVRYSRSGNVNDSLMDLCISLESLLDSQTEVSFRFGTCLAKVTGEKGNEAEETARLLSDLYDLRSKIVHGADATKERRRIEPHVSALRKTARAVLTNYVLFLSENSRAAWKQHLHSLLFR